MRHPDGRHAVLDAAGNVLGLHNSLQSAQRQMGDYYEPQGSAGIPENTFKPPMPGDFQNAPMSNAAPVAVQQAAYQNAADMPVHPAVAMGAAAPGPPGSQLAAGMAMGKMWAAGHPNATPQDYAHAANALRQVQASMQPAQMPAGTAGVQAKMQAQQDLARRAAIQAQQAKATQSQTGRTATMPSMPALHG
jgi:hypothetical protein